jgi:hypothetical protein
LVLFNRDLREAARIELAMAIRADHRGVADLVPPTWNQPACPLIHTESQTEYPLPGSEL